MSIVLLWHTALCQDLCQMSITVFLMWKSVCHILIGKNASAEHTPVHLHSQLLQQTCSVLTSP